MVQRQVQTGLLQGKQNDEYPGDGHHRRRLDNGVAVLILEFRHAGAR